MTAAAPAPIIVSALMGAADFAWADAQRRRHFPPERNHIAAHITLFHHLAPSLADELCARLAAEARGSAPAARIAGVMKLGQGTAYRIESEGLAAVRARLAQAFAGMLTPQDAAGWRAHLTIQNKVSRAAADALHAELSAGFVPRPIAIAGLAAWWYRGGPWERIAAYPFRGQAAAGGTR